MTDQVPGDASFSCIGRIDVKPIRDALIRHHRLFSDVTFRQDHELSPHRSTETIYLRWPPDFSIHSALFSMEVVNHKGMLIWEFRDAVDAIGAMTKLPVARAIIVKLKPGGVITPHADQGPPADATERFHIPIATNDQSWLRVGQHKQYMKAGDVWWFDKHKVHDGANEGETDRIHLIVDCLR